MTRITISLPSELASAVEREARRRRVPVSQIAREALVTQLGRDRSGRLPFAALGRSGHRSTARNAEAILAVEWGEEPGPVDARDC